MGRKKWPDPAYACKTADYTRCIYIYTKRSIDMHLVNIYNDHIMKIRYKYSQK